MLPELRNAGITMFWLPPPCDAADMHGYLSRKWYDLNSSYGSAGELEELIFGMHEAGMVPMLDVVINHRCASEKDEKGRWLEFEEPTWGAWAICCNSPAVPGGTGAPTTGEPAQYAPSVDHTNPKVQFDVQQWIRFMMEKIGFR